MRSKRILRECACSTRVFPLHIVAYVFPLHPPLPVPNSGGNNPFRSSVVSFHFSSINPSLVAKLVVHSRSRKFDSPFLATVNRIPGDSFLVLCAVMQATTWSSHPLRLSSNGSIPLSRRRRWSKRFGQRKLIFIFSSRLWELHNYKENYKQK